MSADDSFRLHADAAVRHPRPRPPRSSPVTVTRVHPVAWALALNAAGGDLRRIIVVNCNELIVQNSISRVGVDARG
jgi:hypothetical protein